MRKIVPNYPSAVPPYGPDWMEPFRDGWALLDAAAGLVGGSLVE
jgi:hypothetical protein